MKSPQAASVKGGHPDPPTVEQCKAMRAVCPSFNLRRTERMVTEHFNAALSSVGVTVTQIPVLAALRVVGSSTLSGLAELLVLDLSTLSRNLLVLQRRGLVEVGPGKDRRTRMASLSSLGLRKLAEAYPVWLAAQSRVAESLSSPEHAASLELLREATRRRSPATS